MVVLPLVPHPVPSEAAQQMLEQPRGTLDGALGEVFVLEPAGDRSQRCVVPGLAVREPLVELADEVRGFLRYSAHRPRRDFFQPPARSQQRRRREKVADPDRFEVRGEEQPTRSQDVVLVRVSPIGPGVRAQNLDGPIRRRSVVCERRQRRQVRGALREPQVLVAGPMTVVPLPGEGLPAARTAVRRRIPRVEYEGGAVLGTDAAIGREQRLRFRDRRKAGEERRRALGEVREQGHEIRCPCDLLPTRRQLFGRHHARTPSSAQRTGRTVAPAARAAAMAGAGSSPVMKNIEPPAPAPAAFPPSAPAAVKALSSWAISGVRIPGSSACCCVQLSESSVATRPTSPARSASVIAAATSFIARNAPVTRGSPRSYAAVTRAIVAPETRDRPV